MLITSPRNNVQISYQARHVFQVLTRNKTEFDRFRVLTLFDMSVKFVAYNWVKELINYSDTK